jgi:hypothetical protein
MERLKLLQALADRRQIRLSFWFTAPYDAFMNLEYFQELLNKRPFEPFAVHLSSGEVYAVRYPGCAALTRTRLVITDPDADRIAVCSLLHIASVDLLQSAA